MNVPFIQVGDLVKSKDVCGFVLENENQNLVIRTRNGNRTSLKISDVEQKLEAKETNFNEIQKLIDRILFFKDHIALTSVQFTNPYKESLRREAVLKRFSKKVGAKILSFGCYRMAFEYKKFIIKVPFSSFGNDMNQKEYEFWNEHAKESSIQNNFLPCLHHYRDCNVYPLIFAFHHASDAFNFIDEIDSVCVTLKKEFEEKDTSFIIDLYVNPDYPKQMTWTNWGLYNGKVVILDYAL